MSRETLIVAGFRTPIGALNGALSTLTAPQLGSVCIKETLARTGLDADKIDEVIMGNVVSAGVGQNPARQASILAGLPVQVGAMTINKVCGSGLKAVMLADQAIRLGDAGLVIAGGMESMSRAPYLLTKAREGYRLGHGDLLDSLIVDGLWDVYGSQHMGAFGDLCASEYGFSRREQDDYAILSHQRARRAIAGGDFDSEIVPVDVSVKGKVTRVDRDEAPARFDETKLRGLKPAFNTEGTITPGNASSINDGAAALLLGSNNLCDELDLKPIARIVGSCTFSQTPEWFTTAPIGAIRQLLDQVGWSVEETDLFEINEAFAVVAMVAIRELSIPADRVNIYGGAVALGHPIGCSGARILVTLLNALKRNGRKRGVASLCIGGGEAVALAVEMLTS